MQPLKDLVVMVKQLCNHVKEMTGRSVYSSADEKLSGALGKQAWKKRDEQEGNPGIPK